MASDVGSDGVALDSAIRTPRLLSGAVDPGSYPPAFDLMLKGISDVMPMAIFNSLSPRPDQERLLAFAHGASIEFFGLNDRPARPPTFEANILPYLAAIGRHHDKRFLVFGRAARSQQPYTTYEEDWLWQRYLYSAYLLAAGQNTRWKQHAGFLVSPIGGRAGGLDVYGDALHDLGSALGNYTVGMAFTSECSTGAWFLSVRPSRGGHRSCRSGDRCSRRKERRSLAASASRPARSCAVAPPAVSSARAHSGVHSRSHPLWRWSALQRESNIWHLHLDRTPEGEECEHDLALDFVRYRAARWRLTLSYRTSDKAARVETVVEVDDREQVMRFAVVDSALGVGAGKPRRRVQFRAAPPAASQFARLPVVGAGAPIIADGRWRTLVIDLGAACTGSRRYEFRRAVFARLLGSMDIKQVHLGSRRVTPTDVRRPRR